MATMVLPNSMRFNGKELPLWTFDQLEQLGKLNLTQRALNL